MREFVEPVPKIDYLFIFGCVVQISLYSKVIPFGKHRFLIAAFFTCYSTDNFTLV